MKAQIELPEIILEMVAQKDFEALAPIEKEFVLKHTCQEEFNDYRKSHLLLKESLEKGVKGLGPKAETEEYLLRRFKQKNRKPEPKIRKLMKLNIPLWQAAAVFLLFLCFFSLKGQKAELSGKSALTLVADTVYLAVHDTIEVVKKDTIFITNEKAQNKKQPAVKITAGAIETNAFNLPERENLPDINLYKISRLKEIINSGRSLKEDSIAGAFGFVAM